MRLIITLDGPDAEQALAELRSNIQYDKLNVVVEDERYYAMTRWHAEDVQAIRESWPIERCEAELANIQNRAIDLIVQHGWDVLEQLLPGENSPWTTTS